MYFTKKERIVIIVIVSLVAFLSFFKIFNPDTKEGDIVEEIDELDTSEDMSQEELTEEVDLENQEIVIHLAGQVANPGILRLTFGDRVIDAIELSGGLTEEADISSINLARKLADEEKVYIPKLGEKVVEENIDNKGQLEDKDSPSSMGMLDINTCSREELMTLPGIGEKTADKILDYREGNLFKTIDDIKKVSGIGDKKFEAIKDMIKVN